MSDDGTERYYRDKHHCCMDCGCETFVETNGLYDRCSSCGSLRDVKRGIEKGEELSRSLQPETDRQRGVDDAE